MRYEGYNLEIEGLQLPYINGINIFANSSYKLTKNPRLIYEWTDETGKIHHDTSIDERVVISFTIKDRSLEEHQFLLPLFSKSERLTVKYYDDFDDQYKTSEFFVENKEETTGIVSRDSIYYAPLQIILKEY